VVLAIIVCTVSSTMVMIATASIVVAAAPPTMTSETTGFMTVLRATGQTIGAQIIVFLLSVSTFSNSAHGRGEFPTNFSYVLTLSYIALTCVGMLVAGLLLPKRAPGETARKTAPAAA
jgi:hypothetical protein